jgi:hypothetical protein
VSQAVRKCEHSSALPNGHPRIYPLESELWTLGQIGCAVRPRKITYQTSDRRSVVFNIKETGLDLFVYHEVSVSTYFHVIAQV